MSTVATPLPTPMTGGLDDLPNECYMPRPVPLVFVAFPPGVFLIGVCPTSAFHRVAMRDFLDRAIRFCRRVLGGVARGVPNPRWVFSSEELGDDQQQSESPQLSTVRQFLKPEPLPLDDPPVAPQRSTVRELFRSEDLPYDGSPDGSDSPGWFEMFRPEELGRDDDPEIRVSRRSGFRAILSADELPLDPPRREPGSSFLRELFRSERLAQASPEGEPQVGWLKALFAPDQLETVDSAADGIGRGGEDAPP